MGIYIDVAKTARKNLHKRAEIDILLFCRLDHWFRSVADYYKVMEILEAHNYNWVTSDEEYNNTSTANGRLYINIKLSIAQNEADIDSERIDIVFGSKIAHGTVLSGNCLFGYTTNSEKRLEIIPKNADIVRDAYNYFESVISQRATKKYIRERYGVNWGDFTFRHLLSEKLYTGIYDHGGRYHDNFCPPIISKEQFEQVQTLLSRNDLSVPSGRIYIFTFILKCAECNCSLVDRIAYKRNNLYYYRCNRRLQRGRCSYKKEIREDYLEKWLFANLAKEIR